MASLFLETHQVSAWGTPSFSYKTEGSVLGQKVLTPKENRLKFLLTLYETDQKFSGQYVLCQASLVTQW